MDFTDIKNTPFNLIELFNKVAALGALDAEATDVLPHCPNHEMFQSSCDECYAAIMYQFEPGL